MSSALESNTTTIVGVEGPPSPADPADLEWLRWLGRLVGVYLVPGLTWVGVAFNWASVLFLRQKGVRLRKSLVTLFTFLNIFDSLFLICTFLVFGLPNLSPWYRQWVSQHLVPYVLPSLQTCLSISVYSTVAIAINGYLIVNPSQESAARNWIKFSGVNVAAVGSALIFVLAFVLNLPRWFELRTEYREGSESDGSGGGGWVLVLTEMRTNPDYIQYYNLLFNAICMVFLPFGLLSFACVSIHRSMVSGTQKRKTLRLMTIIILMFLVCHLPKVIVTVYEVSYHRHDGGLIKNWSTWARVLKEFSHVLLISYSAFNPVAYCGDLVVRSTFERLVGCSCCCTVRDRSEIEIMESFGVTVRGGDSIEQQLRDLDPQSRILSGLGNTTAAGATKGSSSVGSGSKASNSSSSSSSCVVKAAAVSPKGKNRHRV